VPDAIGTTHIAGLRVLDEIGFGYVEATGTRLGTEAYRTIGDRLVNDLPPRDRDIAMVFQNYALYPHRTVRANMGFALELAQVHVILGVRPEDLEPADAAGNGAGLRFDALVDSVESTGADLYVHARVQGGLGDPEHLEARVDRNEGAVRSRASEGAPRLVARLDPMTGARPGGRITLHVDPDQIYAFEPASGRSLAGARATDGEKSVARRRGSIEVPEAPL
jgi:ABC-type sugar transport system ATPase subunit